MKRKSYCIYIVFIICSLFMLFGYCSVNAASEIKTGNANKIITLDKTKIIKVKAKKKSLKVTWNKVNKATGYQYAYKTKKAKKYKYKKTTLTSVKIKKLKSNKKYSVKVRAYTKVNGKNVYGSWSNVKSVKTKKSIKKKASKNRSAIVYVTRTGRKYHSHSGCRGLSHAKEIFYTSMSDAISSGLTKCKLCW